MSFHIFPTGCAAGGANPISTCFFSDYRMPEMDGVNFLTSTKHFHPNAMRLILSGTADFDVLIAAINRAEIYRFIAKPAFRGVASHPSIKRCICMTSLKRIRDFRRR